MAAIRAKFPDFRLRSGPTDQPSTGCVRWIPALWTTSQDPVGPCRRSSLISSWWMTIRVFSGAEFSAASVRVICQHLKRPQDGSGREKRPQSGCRRAMRNSARFGRRYISIRWRCSSERSARTSRPVHRGCSAQQANANISDTRRRLLRCWQRPDRFRSCAERELTTLATISIIASTGAPVLRSSSRTSARESFTSRRRIHVRNSCGPAAPHANTKIWSCRLLRVSRVRRSGLPERS